MGLILVSCRREMFVLVGDTLWLAGSVHLKVFCDISLVINFAGKLNVCRDVCKIAEVLIMLHVVCFIIKLYYASLKSCITFSCHSFSAF